LYTAVSRENAFLLVEGNRDTSRQMEKKWDTVIPADLKRLFLSGTYMSGWSRKG
jgi:hypothetical protein